jgi:hypothetical protein
LSTAQRVVLTCNQAPAHQDRPPATVGAPPALRLGQV